MLPREPQLGLFWGTLARLMWLVGALGVVWALAYWLQVAQGPLSAPAGPGRPLLLNLLALLVSCGLVAWTAWRLNRPVEALHQAAGRVRDGDLDSRLDEQSTVREIREVNAGFNRMARELARVEQDRAVMLAGISHDLRTPLARLRLEAEMSVADPHALAHMAADIDQLNAIIDKFTDYARPDLPALQLVDLQTQLEALCGRVEGDARVRLAIDRPAPALAMADPTDLLRVLVNLVENAARYARGADGGPAEVSVQAQVAQEEIDIRVCDRGPGVPPHQLGQLVQPFFRGNAARTEATGAGLGLAIVDKAVQRMKGRLAFRNLPGQGLEVRIVLPRAPVQAGS
jgi:two-component system osmolarity sensor histidine kinase EnvZ